MQTVRYVFNQDSVSPNMKMYSWQKKSVFFTVFNRSGLTAKGVNCVMLPYSAVFKLVPYVFGHLFTTTQHPLLKTN